MRRWLHTTSLCDCYMQFKHRLLLKPYLSKLKGKQRIQLSQFRCAPFTSPRVRERFTDNDSQHPFAIKKCKADEYHLIMVCEKLREKRVELLPKFFNSKPNMIKFAQLMNTVNIELLKNFLFSVLLSIMLVRLVLVNFSVCNLYAHLIYTVPKLNSSDFFKFKCPSGFNTRSYHFRYQLKDLLELQVLNLKTDCSKPRL